MVQSNCAIYTNTDILLLYILLKSCVLHDPDGQYIINSIVVIF